MEVDETDRRRSESLGGGTRKGDGSRSNRERCDGIA